MIAMEILHTGAALAVLAALTVSLLAVKRYLKSLCGF